MYDSQRTFAAGELSPAVQYRIDIQKIEAGLKTCSNFFVKKEGGVTYRNGTEYIVKAGVSAKKVRIIPFIFSDDTTYLMEFGHNYIRFIRNGDQILLAGVPYQVTTTYTESEIFDLKYEQSLDTVTITHLAHAPANLVRVAETNWTLTNIVFNPVAYFADPPSTVTYFQQRRVFGHNTGDPENIWMSNVGLYDTFTLSGPIVDSDTVSFTLAGRRYNEIRHLVEIGGNFVVLTKGGEWVIKGNADGLITPTSINATNQSDNGASNIRPLIVGDILIYEQARGSVWRDSQYEFTKAGLKTRDLTVLSAHLFTGYTFVDATYQHTYENIVWLVRSDGKMLGMTYLPEQDVWGWHIHETDGIIESIASVPENGSDAVYMVVNRTGGRYIERMATTSVSSNVMDRWHVDSGLSYNGTNTTVVTMSVAHSTGWTVDDPLIITSSAGYFVAGDVGNSIRITVNGVVVTFTIALYLSTTTVRVYASMDVPVAFQDTAIVTWAKGVDNISGLDHLNGKTVSIIADGGVLDQQVVTAGAITLDRPYVQILAGLPYTGILQTLNIDRGDRTLIAGKKQIMQVDLVVESARGIFAGVALDRLEELPQRTVENYGDPVLLTTGKVEIVLPSNWDDYGSIYIQQTDPLPLSLLAIAPQYRVSK